MGESFRKHDMKLGGKGGGGQEPRKMDAKHIMNNMQQVFQPPQGTVTEYIRKHDSENSSGAIKNHLDILDKLLKKGDAQLASLKGMLGGGMMSSIGQSQNQQQQQGQQPCPPGQRYDETQKKCVQDCPQGQIWDEAKQQCVDDPGKYVADIDGSTGSPNSLPISV